MTFLQYPTGLVTYQVCASCHAYNVRPFEHDCDSEYTRFLRKCACPSCKGFRAWLTAGNTSSP
jgi:hypothetical protein